MMSRVACVAIASLAMLSPSFAFRVKPKRRTASSAGGGQVLASKLRDKARASLDGKSVARTLETSLTRKGETPTPAPPTPPAYGPKVITLGDSYSSGTGIHKSWDQYVGGSCWRDERTTPGASLSANVGLPFVNNACKGGEIADIHQQFEEIKARHPDDVATGFNGSTILFTIGGNDIRTFGGESWPSLLTSCIMTFYGACHEKQENQIANWDELQATLREFYTKVAVHAPNARIRVLGYPRLMQRKSFCIPVPGLNFNAADWADAQVDELNRRLRQTTNEVRSQFAPMALVQEASIEDKLRQKATAQNGNVAVSALETSVSRKDDGPAPAPAPPPPPPSTLDMQFVDPTNYFSRGACRVSKKDVNAIVLDGFSLSDSSFHPSQRGYNKYYEALADSMGLKGASIPESEEVPDHDSFMHILEGWDTSGDGKLDIAEVLSMAAPATGPGDESIPSFIEEQGRAFFAQADKDKDGYLNLTEFEEFATLVEAAEDASTTTTTTIMGQVIVGVQSVALSSKGPPPGYLPEDTNKGFGFWSKYVYVKARVETAALGCSGFVFRKHSDAVHYDMGTGDLAEGAGGKYRYLVPVGTALPEDAVKRVWWQEGRGNNAGNCTGDINDGRGGRYLFFCWSTLS